MIDYHKEFGHLSGLERLRKFESQQRFGMAENLGYEVLNAEEGTVLFRYCPKESHVNLIGGIHGGVIASLLDTAMGAAVMTHLAPWERHTVHDLYVKFIKRLLLDAEPIEIEARTEHHGRRISCVEGWVRDSEGSLIARGSASAVIL